MTSAPKASPVRSRFCHARSSGVACDAEAAARYQLWWTAQQAAEQAGRPPAQADHLRQWAGVLIDALLAFEDDMAQFPGPHADIWRQRMSLSTRHRLQPITENLAAKRWLVHARHRTQIRLPLSTERRLFLLWVSHLAEAVLGLIGQTAAAAAQSRKSGGDPGVTAYLLNVRHNLLHACQHLNRHVE
ncbi:hypothetical protein ABZ341_27960 [Streptomyces sp. NPDC006173]|uniref:hypothetical protein n=1 Tax=Streptomyces sp. NPDC006173 TaxID=3155349 RepID=UPI0033F38440